MVDDLISNKTFEIPIIKSENKSKGEKEGYKQYSLKLPMSLVKIMGIKKGSKLIIELLPIKGQEEYPELNVRVKQ